MSSPNSHRSGFRLGFIDILRGLAIILMVCVHGVRGFIAREFKTSSIPVDATPIEAFTIQFQSFLFTTEPYTSALFLTLVGFTLVLATHGLEARYAQSQMKPLYTSWNKKVLRRGIQLILISWLLFSARSGVQWPWPFVSSDILQNIGLGMLCMMFFAKKTKYRIPGLLGIMLVGIVVTALTEQFPDHATSFLAQGPGALFPNIIFFPFGGLLAIIFFSGNAKLKVAVPVLGGCIVAWTHFFWVPSAHVDIETQWNQYRSDRSLKPRHVPAENKVCTRSKLWKKPTTDLQTIFNLPKGRIYTTREFVTDGKFELGYQLAWLGEKLGIVESVPKAVIKCRTFWNKRLQIVPYLMGLLMLTFGVGWLNFWKYFPLWMENFLKPIKLMGSWSLRIYITHLIVIAVAIVVATKLTALNSMLCILGLNLGCWVLAYGSQKRAERLRL